MFKLIHSLGVSKIILLSVVLGLSLNSFKLHVQRNKALNKVDKSISEIAELKADINDLHAANNSLKLNADSLIRQIVNNDSICKEELAQRDEIYRVLKNSSTVAVHTPIKTTSHNNNDISKEVSATVEVQYIEVVDSETSNKVVEFINDIYGVNNADGM